MYNKNLFEDYLEDVKLQLTENENRNPEYISFNYTEKQIYENIEYFKDCLQNRISAYKSLLFFGDFLKDECKL